MTEGPATESDEDSFIQSKDRPTDRQCAAIGRVASTWAVVELMMERLLHRLSMTPSLMGYVLTDRLGPDGRIDAIKSLLNVHRRKYADEIVSADVREELEELLRGLRSAKEDRNHIVHTVWTAANADFVCELDMTGAARSGTSFTVGGGVRIETIEDFSKTAQALADRLFSLTNRIPDVDAALLARVEKRESRVGPLSHGTRTLQRRPFTTFPPAQTTRKHQLPTRKQQSRK